MNEKPASSPPSSPDRFIRIVADVVVVVVAASAVVLSCTNKPKLRSELSTESCRPIVLPFNTEGFDLC
jgi:hypothetical protein